MQAEDDRPEDGTEDELDGFLDSIGLDVKPLSPEHAFMVMLTGGHNTKGYQKIHNYRWWVRHEIFGWFDLVENNAEPCKKEHNINKDEMIYRPLTREEYVIVRTKYYLRMNNLPWFIDNISGIGVADIDKTARMMIEHEVIKPLLTAKKEDMPRNI